VLVRRTIEELSARYFLEPELEDIIVEGEFDRDVLNMVLSEQEDCRAVYEIDTIHVESELLVSYGFSSGNKQRVIALANELAKACSEECKYICMVDKDIDHWIGTLGDVRNLKWSKYTSLDAHFYRQGTTKRLLVACGKAQVEDFPRLFWSMGHVLCSLYRIRVAGAILDFTFRWPDFTKSLSIEAGELRFDLDGFKRKLLQNSGLSKRAADLNAKLQELEGAMEGQDIRDRIRGHDLIDVMAWVLRKTKGVREFSTSSAISRLLVLEAPRVAEIYDEICTGVAEQGAAEDV